MADTIDVATGSADNTVEMIVRSAAWQRVLKDIDQRAKAAAFVELRSNAWGLIALGVAGGVVGAYLFKGKAAAIIAGLVGAYAGSQLLGLVSPKEMGLDLLAMVDPPKQHLEPGAGAPPVQQSGASGGGSPVRG